MASQNLQAWVHWVFINERLQLETSSQRLLAWNRWICLTRDHCLRRHFNIYKRETTGHLNKRPPSATAFQHLWEWHRWIFERETTWDGIVTFVSVKPLDPLNEAPLFKPFSSEFLSVKPLDVLNERALFEQHFNNFKRGTTGYIEWDTSWKPAFQHLLVWNRHDYWDIWTRSSPARGNTTQVNQNMISS